MERISVARSAPPHFAAGEPPEPLDERACVAVLGEAGRLDLVGDEGTLHVGTGNAFWQVRLVRDGSGALVALGGEHDVEVFGDDTDLDVLYDRVQDVARRLGATAWVGDRSLTPAEALWRLGRGPMPDDDGPDLSQGPARRRWWRR